MPFKSVHPYEETEAGDEQLLKKNPISYCPNFVLNLCLSRTWRCENLLFFKLKLFLPNAVKFK